MAHLTRPLLLFCILLFSIALQVRAVEAGWGVNAALATLVVFAFRVSLAEQLALASAAAFLLNWRIGLAPELLFFWFFPVSLFFVQPYFPWRRGIVLLVAVPAGIIAFSAIASGAAVFGASLLWWDVGASAAWAAGLFVLLKRIYEPSAHKSRASPYFFPR